MAVSSSRLVLKPYTFSNGITVSSGTFLAVPIWPIHMDEKIYNNPHEFDGFRFSRSREEGNEKKGFKAFRTSLEYLTFGHGLHSWYVPFLQKVMSVQEDFWRLIMSS
jgi:cytochrome P450